MGSPFFISEEVSSPGQQTCVKVIAQGYQDISAFQYSVLFDGVRLSYSSVIINEDSGLGLNLAANFNLSLVAQGIINVAYTTPDGTGLSLDDGTILYQICFEALSQGFAEVKFAGVPTPISILNSDLAEVALTTEITGGVDIRLCEDVVVTIDTSICEGQSVTVGDLSFDTPGSFEIPLSSNTGDCDSLVVLNLSIASVGFSFPDTVTVCAGADEVTLTVPDSIRVGLSIDSLGSSVTLAAGESYTLLLASVNNPCTSTQVVFVGDFIPAQINIEGPSAFCAGGEAELTVMGGVSYLWSTGETTATIVVDTAGLYSVTATTLSGCTGTANKQVQALSPLEISIAGPLALCSGGGVNLEAMGAEAYLWSTGDTTATIVADTVGTYSVVGTDANGCTATASVTLVEGSSPVVFIEGDDSFCSGDTLLLTATGAASYLWSTGDTTATLSVTSAGQYTVTGTDSLGCPATATRTIVELPIPTVSFLGTLEVCAGDTTSITAVGGTGYLWSTGDTTATVALVAGTYSVTLTNAGGCEGEGSVTIAGDTVAPVFIYCPPSPQTGVLNFGQTTVPVSWIPALATDDCGTEGITLTSTSEPGDSFSLGATTVTYTATDASGNESTCSFEVQIRNSDSLTFYVDSLGVTYLGDTACVSIRVLNFDVVDGFQYTLSTPEPQLGQIVGIQPLGLLPGLNNGDVDFFAIDPDTYGIIWANNGIFGVSLPDSAAIFIVKMLLNPEAEDCAPLAIVGTPVDIEAAQNGGVGTVPTVIGSGVCPLLTVNITGQVLKINEVPIGRAEISLSGGATDLDITLPQGFYGFSELPAGETYTLTPARDFDDAEGISVLDIVRIIQHVLFVNPFGNDPFSPFLYIAADVTNDQIIDVADAVELQDLILGRISALNSNESWRFVPVAYSFPDPVNPWLDPFPELVTLPDLTDDATVDFWGVKVGDLNLSAVGQVQDPGTSFFVVPDVVFQPGQIVEVPVRLSDADQWAGFQTEFDFDPRTLQYLGAEAGDLPEFTAARCVATERAGQGRLPILWAGMEGDAPVGTQTMFTLRFRAQQAGSLSSALGLSARGLPSMAVTPALKTLDLGLTFERVLSAQYTAQAGHLSRLYAMPNPLGSEGTALRFELAKAEQVSITLYNAQGQLVYSGTQHLGAGTNTLLLGGEHFRQAGLYSCRLQAGTQVETIRVIKQ